MKCGLSSGNLPLGSLAKNYVVRMFDCPNMTIAVGQKHLNRQKDTVPYPAEHKNKLHIICQLY